MEPRPGRRRFVTWFWVAAASILLVGVAVLVVVIGLDQADKIASVAGFLIGVAGLGFSAYAIVQAKKQPSAPPPQQQFQPYPGYQYGLPPPRHSSSGAGAVVVVILVALCLVGGGSTFFYALSLLKNADLEGGNSPSGSPKAPGASAAPAVATVLWKDEILIDKDVPRDFDYEPPARGNLSIDLNSDGVLYGSTYSKYWGGGIALWTGDKDPTYDECATRITTHGVKEVGVDAKSRICLLTNQGRVVYIKFLARSGNGYNAEVTIWSRPQ